MPILRLLQNEAGDTIYKDLKQEILQLYGSKDEDAFNKAISLKMTGKPSAFGKKLVHILCPGAKPFDSCHCARIVYGFWVAQLTPAIKSQLAGKKFNKDTYKDLFIRADEVWVANGGSPAPPTVIAAVAQPSTVVQPSVQEDQPQVSAIQRGGRGRGNRGRGNRGGGRGTGRGAYNSNSNQSNQSNSNSPSSKPHQKGPKHPDLPSNAAWACAQHWKKGRSAPYCSDPTVCQWNQVYVPRT